jgi:hypothetical protein
MFEEFDFNAPEKESSVTKSVLAITGGAIYSLLHNCVPQRIAHGVAFAFELE